MIPFTCSNCGHVGRLKPELAGKRVKCPACNSSSVAASPFKSLQNEPEWDNVARVATLPETPPALAEAPAAAETTPRQRRSGGLTRFASTFLAAFLASMLAGVVLFVVARSYVRWSIRAAVEQLGDRFIDHAKAEAAARSEAAPRPQRDRDADRELIVLEEQLGRELLDYAKKQPDAAARNKFLFDILEKVPKSAAATEARKILNER